MKLGSRRTMTRIKDPVRTRRAYKPRVEIDTDRSTGQAGACLPTLESRQRKPWANRRPTGKGSHSGEQSTHVEGRHHSSRL